ncbi:unnamed protein product [Vicia faba]|uniref:Uncharacterized protein n=1 Tax=Vicia faba TaxID=3906 RepID=A0AAV1B697_VICFA|nr:unnamed protein product [Vicia faba]
MTRTWRVTLFSPLSLFLKFASFSSILSVFLPDAHWFLQLNCWIHNSILLAVDLAINFFISDLANVVRGLAPNMKGKGKKQKARSLLGKATKLLPANMAKEAKPGTNPKTG